MRISESELRRISGDEPELGRTNGHTAATSPRALSVSASIELGRGEYRGKKCRKPYTAFTCSRHVCPGFLFLPPSRNFTLEVLKVT